MDTIYPPIKSGVPYEIKQFIHLYPSILYLYPFASVSIYIVLWIQSWIQSIHPSNLEFHMKLNNLSICIVLSWSQSIHLSNLEFQIKLNNLSICIQPYCICIHLYLYLYPYVSVSICNLHLYLYLYPSVLYYHGYNHGYNLSIHQILWMFLFYKILDFDT